MQIAQSSMLISEINTLVINHLHDNKRLDLEP